MDSPHSSIEAWWPDDAPEFALTSDERFIERYQTVETLLGSNMPLPEGMQEERSEPIDATNLIEEYEERAQHEAWDGIYDAFEPIRSLIGAGPAGRSVDLQPLPKCLSVGSVACQSHSKSAELGVLLS